MFSPAQRLSNDSVSIAIKSVTINESGVTENKDVYIASQIIIMFISV